MTNLIKQNGKYGDKIGNIIVFTKQGAIETYKKFLEVCYKDFSIEVSSVLSKIEEDMIRIGFDFEELEEMEIQVLKTI